jgi:methionyl-tRNA synthetase
MLSGDMLSRYYRLMNDDVIFVSGCDEYGERMERKANTDSISPRELADINYAKVGNLLRSFNIELSHFGRTTDVGHTTFVQECMSSLLRNGHIEEQLVASPFCRECDRFVSDVFVLGVCTSCGRFDNLNDHYASITCAASGPVEFRNTICGICKSTGVNSVLTREPAKRWLIRLNRSPVLDMTRWTEVARNETVRALRGVSDWMSISRSVEWGVQLPFDASQTVFSWADSLLAVPMLFSTLEPSMMKAAVESHLVGGGV